MLIDLEQECGVGLHAHMMLVSIPLILFHVLIVPLVIFLTLRRAGEKKRQQDPSVMFRWGLIHSGYRNDRYWWEFVVLERTMYYTHQLKLFHSMHIRRLTNEARGVHLMKINGIRAVPVQYTLCSSLTKNLH